MSRTKYMKRSTIIVRVAMLMTAVFILAGCGGTGKIGGRSKSISIRDAILLTTEGYDGAGKLNITIDPEILAGIVADANPEITEAQFSELYRVLEVVPSEKEQLSNGQEITISVVSPSVLLEQMKLALAEESFAFQVTDLKPVEEIDPFAYVETEITGLSPKLDLKLKTKWVNDEVGSLHYLVNGNNIGEGTLGNVAI